MNKAAPQDMRQHLMLNQSRLSTAEEVAQEFEDYWDATEEFFRVMTRVTLDSLLQLVQALRKVEDLKVPTTLERVGDTKGKGKKHKGLGFQPERGEQRKFGGYCNWCWRIGHKEAQCWFKQEYMKSNPPQDLLQRDIREWTNTSEKGQGHSQPKKVKVMAKARENIQEKETTTRTRLALRMKKLDSARWVILT